MTNQLLIGDVLEQLKTLPSNSISMCCTSPPYWGQRDYHVEGQIGQEKTPELYVAKMVEVFHEVKRVLKENGTLWLNEGDGYAGSLKGAGGTGALSAKQNTNRGANYAHGKSVPVTAKIAGLKNKDFF